MHTNEITFKRLVVFSRQPHFDVTSLTDEEFEFVVCGRDFELLCRQLLQCDAIVMIGPDANGDHAKICPAMQLRQTTPMLIVMADDWIATPGYLHAYAVIPEEATAKELLAELRSIPRRASTLRSDLSHGPQVS